MNESSKALYAKAEKIRIRAAEAERLEKVADIKARLSKLGDVIEAGVGLSELDKVRSALVCFESDVERYRRSKRSGLSVAAVRAGNGVWDGRQ